MQNRGTHYSSFGLENHGLRNANDVYWNLTTPLLYEEAVRRHEGRLTHLGPLVVRTGQHTGRSPNAKFIVREPTSADHIWWGRINRPMEPSKFEALRRRLLSYLDGKDLFVQDCFVRSDPEQPLPIRVITETAWHSLFAHNMFVRATPEEMKKHIPQFTMIHAPSFQAIPSVDGTESGVFIVIHFGKKLILIGGTLYAGEIKKSIFTLLNYLLPLKNVLPLHSSANRGPKGDVAIFFGLSGTGKTTLSTESSRALIGDDELGWNDKGVFNFEGGCYAKVIRLSAEAEPEIYQTTERFGTILENVVYDTTTGHIDLNDDTITENTRASYPMTLISNAICEGVGGPPQNIVMLTADAFGVLPPIAKLTVDQARYHFLSGYTAKVAGTEKGIVEPEATFSPCFGGPFMPLFPGVYAKLLGEKITKHKTSVWLVNTGWSGGPYGVGQRIKIAYTRQMVHAALTGALKEVPCAPDPVFNLEVPATCPEVPSKILNPRNTWANKEAYDTQARKLAAMFNKNFETYASDVPPQVKKSGPAS